jgi:hypothetical protein
MNGHTRRQLLAANTVGSGQRLDDCRSPSRDCPNCGAKAVLERGRSSVRRWEYTSPRGRRGDSTPRARKRDRSESQEIFEPRRPRRHDDTTTPLSKTLGVGREDTVILPTHKWLPVQSWLETSGTPHDQVVGFLSEDPTRTHGVLAEIEKWRVFIRGQSGRPCLA